MEYLKLFSKLDEQKVRYLICGGLAVNIYGIPRMTADIDFLLDFNEQNLLAFENVMNEIGYKPTLPIKLSSLFEFEKRKLLKDEKNLIAFSFFNQKNNLMSVDIILDLPISFEKLWKNKTIRKFETTEVYLVSVDDLIALKEYSGREQDKQDIIFLKQYKK
ncbi:MAG: nucleotidyl transferase AbiEii/AbiGii toxin family protein [Bacteroidia bacterium]